MDNILENWKEELRNEVFPLGIWHDHPRGYERRVSLMEAFISSLLEAQKDLYTKGLQSGIKAGIKVKQ